MRKWLRRARWLLEQIDALLVPLLCLPLLVFLLPLVPLLRAYDNVRGLYGSDGE